MNKNRSKVFLLFTQLNAVGLVGTFVTTVLVCMLSYAAQTENKTVVPEIQLPAKIVEVHDGDTITVEFKIQARIRLIDCWAPELKTKEGDAAKEFLGKLLKPESDVYIKIPFDGKVQKSLSLNRILGKVYRDVDADGVSDNLSEVMVKWGMATETKPKTPKMGL